MKRLLEQLCFLKAPLTDVLCWSSGCAHVFTCACARVCVWHEGEWLSCGFPQASRREFRAHLDEVITLKSRYSTLDQVNPLFPSTYLFSTGMQSTGNQHRTSTHKQHTPTHSHRQGGSWAREAPSCYRQDLKTQQIWYWGKGKLSRKPITCDLLLDFLSIARNSEHWGGLVKNECFPSSF